MKKKILFVLKLFVILLVVIFCTIFFVVRRNQILEYKLDEKRILSNYEVKKEEYDLIYSLLDNVLVEGKYINTQKIPDDMIKYRIYNYNDNVIFSYNLKEEFSSDGEIYAKITLTSDYNVISEEYSSKLESFEEYKETYIKEAKLYATMLAILPILLGMFLILIVIIYFFLIK